MPPTPLRCLPPPRFRALIFTPTAVLCWRAGAGIYEKLDPRTVPQVPGQLAPPGVSVRSEFTICTDCLHIVRAYLKWRKDRPDWRVRNHALDSLEALWLALVAGEHLSKASPMQTLPPSAALRRTPPQLQAQRQPLGAVPVPSLPQYVITQLRNPLPHNDASPLLLRQPPPPPPAKAQTALLLTLPAEIFWLVGEHLDTSALLALRATCRAAAQRLPLDQHWYRERLLNGQLFGFLFAFELVDELHEISWRARGMPGPKPAAHGQRVMERARDEVAEPTERGGLPSARTGAVGPSCSSAYDWRLLAGRLARYENFKPGMLLREAPENFRFRRYTWRNLELMERRIAVTEPFY